jgi:hypothetical protein
VDQGCSFRGTPRIDLITTEISKNRLSYSSNGPKDLWPGVSNYVLQVLSRSHGDPALLMYFLDSGGGSYTEVLSSAQVKWFQSQSQFLNPNGRSESDILHSASMLACLLIVLMILVCVWFFPSFP